MPTVTAIALESLLEPGSSASHHHRRHSSSDPSPASPSPKEHHLRRHSTTGASTSEEHHHHHHHHHHLGGRRQQQPIFLSRQPRGDASHAAEASKNDGGSSRAAGSRAKPPANGYYISPKLYATPEPTRIVPTGGVASSSSSSPNSVSSPSPYVVNHKRRDVPRPPPPPPPSPMVAAGNGDGVSSTEGAKSHLDGADSVAEPPDRSAAVAVRGLTNGTFEICSDGHVGEVAGRGGQGREGIGKVGEEESSLDSRSNKGGFAENEHPDAGIDENDDAEDFFDPRDMMSTMSSSDTEDAGSFRHGGSGRCHTPLASQSEFYDATEDFFSDGSVSRSSSFSRATIEADLRSIRLNLFEEIERRKKAEEILDHMQNMFQRITRQLSLVGSSFPPIQPGVNMQYDVDSAAQLCQEVVVTRFVSEALESGLAQAETEAAAEVIIEAKNHEISRFKDRLQYYEAMNQEMSQRNQEAIELARRQRLRRKVRRRWIWGCIGLSIMVGTSLMVSSYLMHDGKNPSFDSSEYQDHSSETAVSEGHPT